MHSLFQYFSYRLKAKNEHSLHSPFLFDFYTEVIKLKKQYYAFEDIENVRTDLLKSKDKITITDFGAGSKAINSNLRAVSAIAKHSLSSRKTSELLFRMVDYFQPTTIFELGTCLGINTSYLASASEKSQVYTFEGCPNLATKARSSFEKLTISPQIIIGDLGETLKKQVAEIATLDFVFFDANHQYQPTLDYFESCLPKTNENTVFVFDDIHWSEGMSRAWSEIVQHSAVRQSLDLYQVGIVFFRNSQPKQHFVLRF